MIRLYQSMKAWLEIPYYVFCTANIIGMDIMSSNLKFWLMFVFWGECDSASPKMAWYLLSNCQRVRVTKSLGSILISPAKDLKIKAIGPY